jgi:SM-20-related protein
MSAITPALELLAQQNYVLLDPALPQACTKELFCYAQEVHRHGQFHLARVGQGAKKTRRQSIRSDEIAWVQDWSSPSLQPAFKLLENIQAELRSFLFLPIKRYESHFAHYPKGSFYKRHRDQHRLNPSRLISCVLYLSPWCQQNKGELVLYQSGESLRVEPKQGQMILFRSELEHEVLLTHAPRWTLTTWFRDDIIADLNLRS